MYSVEGKSFSVLGLARSGLAAANYLARNGADVFVSDRAPAQKLPLDKLDPRVTVCAGEEKVRQGDVVVISPGIKPGTPAHSMAHELGSEVISDIELFYRLSPAPVLAVTGTDGKSTTTALLGELCAAAGFPVFVGGNIGVACMDGLKQLSKEGLAVLEVSCFQLTHCYQLRPRVALVTNIAEDHVEYHGSFEEYVEAKRRIFQSMGAGDTLVLNGDDELLATWQTPAGCRRRTFGWSQGGEAWCDGQSIFLKRDGEYRRLVDLDRLKLVGRHNAENVMAALLCIDGLFADAFDLVEAIKAFPGLEHRMEFVAKVNGVDFYNDSKATNPHAAMAVVNSFPGNFVVLAGGYEKGSDFGELGRLIAVKTRAAVLYGATRERLAAVIPQGHPVFLVETLQQAIAKSLELALPGDSVVLAPACASFDQFSDFEERGRKFKDWVRQLNNGGENK